MAKSLGVITDPKVVDLLEGRDLTKPVGMLNQLKFRAQAKYAAESGEQPCSGAEAYARYTAGVRPLLDALGAEVILTGVVPLIGPRDEWDRSFVVRYKHATDVLNLGLDPAYQRIMHHRTAALEDSRLLMMDFDSSGLR